MTKACLEETRYICGYLSCCPLPFLGLNMVDDIVSSYK